MKQGKEKDCYSDPKRSFYFGEKASFTVEASLIMMTVLMAGFYVYLLWIFSLMIKQC